MAALACTFASAARADDLWNQQTNFDVDTGISTSNYLPTPSDSIFSVSDVIASSNWTVNQISMVVEAGGPAIGYTSGIINVFQGGQYLPTSANDPSTGTSVRISLTPDTALGQDFYFMTASNLNLSLTKGEYWIGLTPTDPGGMSGLGDVECYANVAGAKYESAFRNPGGGVHEGTIGREVTQTSSA